MNSEFRDFLKAEYDKMSAKEQKAADALADEEKSNRQKGAQKAVATKAQKTFMDMLTKKLTPEEPVEDPTEPEDTTEVPDNEPETSEVPDNEPVEEPTEEPTDDPSPDKYDENN